MFPLDIFYQGNKKNNEGVALTFQVDLVTQPLTSLLVTTNARNRIVLDVEGLYVCTKTSMVATPSREKKAILITRVKLSRTQDVYKEWVCVGQGNSGRAKKRKTKPRCCALVKQNTRDQGEHERKKELRRQQCMAKRRWQVEMRQLRCWGTGRTTPKSRTQRTRPRRAVQT